MTRRLWKVHKFGGTSLADAACFRRVGEILRGADAARQVVVVSAVRGATDALLELLDLARLRDEGHKARLEEIRVRHSLLAAQLLDGEARAGLEAVFEADCKDIGDVLHATSLVGSAPRATRDLVSGYGELWSAQLLAAWLRRTWGADGVRVEWRDARRIVTVEHGELGPVVDWKHSAQKLREQIAADFTGTLVVTGYVAAGPDGVQTTLGRNGSDFSASIFGALLDASEITIWTDVNGVMSADPRLVAEVSVISELSYNEAMELAYFGAKVLHPQTMAPAIRRGIPISIRNTFAPDEPGTRIGECSGPAGGIKGITSIDGMALVNLEGAGMIGVPGTAHRLFGALSRAGISVVMISQGSSEHSICFAVPETVVGRVEAVLAAAFASELEQGQIQSIGVTRGCSILAVVGDAMAGTPGLAAKVFGSLGSAGINVRAVAQGSSERNISAVIDGANATRALRAVHSGFYLSPETLSIGLIGPGTVGGVLLDQMAAELSRLKGERNLDLRVRAIASSGAMLLEERRVDLASWRRSLEERAVSVDLERFADHVKTDQMPHAAIVDCTAEQSVADRYADWLARGIHVITPNKKASTGSWEYYRRLRDERHAGGAHYLYETTVGAGLPIIHTLRDLRETGDRIVRIEGIFSGTLAYLFNVFDGRRPFSEIVGEARANGYTEPDPRDDLSGMDVARKVVILGREMGLRLELSDVEIEGLVPEALQEGSPDDFLAGLSAHDTEMADLLAEARAADRVLRYVGRLDAAGKATVRLERLPRSHPFANIALTDNIVLFETTRYRDNPLIVQGPGAGPEVTAGGVFADLLRLAAYLGAKL